MRLDFEFTVGKEFDSLAQLKNVVKSSSISKNHNYKALESEPTRYVKKCAHECRRNMCEVLPRWTL